MVGCDRLTKCTRMYVIPESLTVWVCTVQQVFIYDRLKRIGIATLLNDKSMLCVILQFSRL